MSRMIVSVPVADMRREPNHHSERVSQALYGFLVSVVEVRSGFRRVATDDHYQGWMSESYLAEVPDEELGWQVVTSDFALFQYVAGSRRLMLPFGARVAADRGEGVHVDHREGRRLKLVNGELGSLEEAGNDAPVAVALSLESAPYLWGGTSPFGFDCSGFVQAVFRRCGLVLPRDSKDQATTGREVSLPDSQAGDIICFPGHVAIHLGKLKIIHATRLRGMVVVESLDRSDPHFRGDLASMVTTVRRVLP